MRKSRGKKRSGRSNTGSFADRNSMWRPQAVPYPSFHIRPQPAATALRTSQVSSPPAALQHASRANRALPPQPPLSPHGARPPRVACDAGSRSLRHQDGRIALARLLSMSVLALGTCGTLRAPIATAVQDIYVRWDFEREAPRR